MYFFFFFSFYSSKYSYLLILPNINFDFLSSLALKSFPTLCLSSNCICYIYQKKTIRFPMPNLVTPAVCGTRFNVALVTLNCPALLTILNANLCFRVARQFFRLRSREYNNRLFHKIYLTCNGNLS